MKDPNDSSGTAPNDPELDADVARLLGSFEGEAPPPGAAAKLLALVDTFEPNDEGAPPTPSSWTTLKTAGAALGLLVTAGLCLVAVRSEAPKTAGPMDVAQPTAIVRTASPARPDSVASAAMETAPAEISVPVMAASALPSAPSPRTAATPSSSAVDSKDSFREQLAIVESARHSLSEKKTDECLETLRRYDTKYPSGLFTTEVQVVRVEALLAAGQSEKAFALARKVIAENPRGPYADRLRALLPKADGLDR